MQTWHGEIEDLRDPANSVWLLIKETGESE